MFLPLDFYSFGLWYFLPAACACLALYLNHQQRNFTLWLPNLALGLGIVFAHLSSSPYAFLILIAAGALVYQFFARDAKRFCLFFGMGALLLNLHQAYGQYVQQFLQNKPPIVVCVRQVETRNNGQTRLICAVERWRYRPFLFPGLVCIFCNKNNLSVSDRLLVRNYSLSPAPSMQTWMCKQGYWACLFTFFDSSIRVLGRANSWQNAWLAKRLELFERMRAKLSGVSQQLFSLLFLGYEPNAGPLQELRDVFGQVGLSHYLARSGLHLDLIVYLWLFLLSVVPIALFWRRMLILGFLAIYFACSWSSVSFLRSLIMLSLFFVGRLVRRPCDNLHLLSIAYLSILLFNPYHLFFVDFQLSFGLVGGIVYFLRLLKK